MFKAFFLSIIHLCPFNAFFILIYLSNNSPKPHSPAPYFSFPCSRGNSSRQERKTYERLFYTAGAGGRGLGACLEAILRLRLRRSHRKRTSEHLSNKP